ncbi:MAG: minor capsid protein, partial [Clostridia bacterium]|nr:minor capsid protein [Clostridia bacterium]
KLPNADKAIIDDRKFSKYLFNVENSDGFAKGKAFTSRLGYDITNYKDLQKEIFYSASRYPAVFKDNNGYGNRYEQKIILYGNNGKPANVVIGWLCNGDSTKMTSAYIKEV